MDQSAEKNECECAASAPVAPSYQMFELFSNEVEQTADSILEHHASLGCADLNTNMLIKYIPTIMDIEERNITRKNLKGMHKKIKSRDDIKSLIDGHQPFGRLKENFVIAVVEKIARKADLDIENIEPHIKAIICSIHDAPSVYRAKNPRSGGCFPFGGCT
jgi:hypothetical protein